MSIAHVLANRVWLASNYAASRRFRSALAAPQDAQRALLQAQITRHARTEFGQTHNFGAITSYAEFVQRVPMHAYSDFSSAIDRMQKGEQGVLCADRVTHLAPTSGSSGARKLIPFTAALTSAFDAAVAPWIADLARQRPRVVNGPAYWSVSPLADTNDPLAHDANVGNTRTRKTHTPSTRNSGAVPIGFADDAEYLGGAKAWLIRHVLAVPSTIRHVQNDVDFWHLTLLALLRQRELRLMSVWHPTFLELMVGAAIPEWSNLIDAVATGANPYADALPFYARDAWRTPPDVARASELRRIGPDNWSAWWPQLQVVSCWGEQAAEVGWHRIESLFAARQPQVLVQRKGLLATEAVVTIPLGEHLPLAVCSHVFEFLDTSGAVHQAHELVRGAQYEVVVTNGAGLWRYQLGDMVECTGHVLGTPTLRFLGRANHVSDLRGEKLSEPFVAEALRSIFAPGAAPHVAVLLSWDDGVAAGYELLTSADHGNNGVDDIARRLEAVLHTNPHYALARRLGQLLPLRVVTVAPDAELESVRAFAGRIGDAKPQTLVGPRGRVVH